MLVVTANWQIGDGSILPPPAAPFVARFIADLRRSAVCEGWRRDGRYEPVRSVDVVFAGDTLDLSLSREWLGLHRPWQRGDAARAVAERVLAGCLAGARRLFGELGSLVRHGIAVPAADARGRPAPARETHVPVRVTLLEGKLDARLGRDGADAIEASCGIVVGTRWEGEAVRVEHGHASDPAWWSEGPAWGAVPTLGQSLRVDLLARFAAAILPDPARPIRDRLVGRLAAGEIGAWPALVAESLAAPAHAPTAPAVEGLAAPWRDAVEGWRRATRRSGILLDAPFDAVDGLAAMLEGEGDADDLASLLGPTTPRESAADVATLVLGHPAAARSRPWGRPRVLCLGGETVREAAAPGVLEVAPVVDRATPGMVVVRGWRAEEDAPPAVRPDGRPRMIGPRHRVVDAA